MKLFNSATQKIEEFKPLNPPKVTFYTCGPTVYVYAHIGNFRTYTTADFLLRTLSFLGFQPHYIMNLTDVGHLTGDNLGDADIGEDRMEKAALKENRSIWEIARFYTKQFYKDFKKLNLIKPDKFVRATDHIQEQIDLIKILEKKGFTYQTNDGIYFDTSKFPDYGKLSTLDKKGLKPGKRTEMRDKKNPTDFALWKLSSKEVLGQKKRQMEWNSPWGVGFPGWHTECSAMSMKYLGETIDIHLGGEDLRSTHHPNEIAQSEAATGQRFVKFWVHGAFITVDGVRMSKSLGNNYTVSDLEEKGFDPMALRYLFLTTHYRKPLNFTFASLQAAQDALFSLAEQIGKLKKVKERSELSEEKLAKIDNYRNLFTQAVSQDLNLPQALAVFWEVVKSNIPACDKYDLLISFNEVFGLVFPDVKEIEIPEEIKLLAQKRQEARRNKDFLAADELRKKIARKGYLIEDKGDLFEIKPQVSYKSSSSARRINR